MTKLWASLSSFTTFALLSFVVVFAAGCGPKWQVVKQTDPTSMKRDSKFAVAPMSFDGLYVGGKSEQEYLGGKEPQQQQDWQNDKKSMVDSFMDGFNGERDAIQTGDGDFVIKPNVSFIEPGYYVGVSAGSAEVRVDVKIFDKAGTLLDEITASSKSGGMSTTQRLRSCAHDLGKITAKYLKKRLGRE